MKATGIVRRIDELGRIVIPKEIRRVLHIREGDPIEIYTEDDAVVLKRYARARELGDAAETYCQALCGALGFSAAVADTETVLYAAGPLKKRLIGLTLSPSFLEKMRQKQALIAQDGYLLSTQSEPVRTVAAVPIVTDGDCAGSVLLCTDDTRLSVRETELGVLKTAALYLGKQLES
ncbi:MAG: AbrB/MazE/SpoVT family DNA-binding domain-containing protein [Clostridia bacterium]|jgi:AbrB family transcriptional regulator (stage V sporulation protein T)|nr:AbrB/MazE/SpoVT family DNA-binding domain-containing protein [Clostridia bacterium]MBR2645703.1 AbrB/MazE/SpoVT family DNA-binding domain-containing protein [Clostridia bacterium]